MVPDGRVMGALIVRLIPTTLTGASMVNMSNWPGSIAWIMLASLLAIFTGVGPSSPEWTTPVSFSLLNAAQFEPCW